MLRCSNLDLSLYRMSQIFSFSFNALGSANQISLCAPSHSLAEHAYFTALEEVQRIETKYSRYQEHSVLSIINRQAKTTKVKVDAETAQLLNYAAACFTQSAGLFDITSGVLRSIWNFSEARIPAPEECEEVCQAIGWQHVVWKEPYIQFARADTEIDFGGIGKEYAVDRVADLLQKQGSSAGFVNLGGDLRAWGKPPNRDCWYFGIRHPRKEGAIIGSVPITQAALATSGDYQRYFEAEGKRYCHILNPFTGMPVCELQSVSVIAPVCTLAGSCSTIVMLFGLERGVAFLREMGLDALVVDRLGQRHLIHSGKKSLFLDPIVD
jgi:FAD:protein FMN transferase